MTQAIHIFLKDARHWRWLIVLQLAMLAARTAMAPRASAFSSGAIWKNPTDLLDLLLPTVWIFTIAVIVHDENLDIDREFWFTRPYSWRSLMAAKALFVAVCILAPLLIADLVTLALDNFAVSPGDLLWFEFCRLLILAPFALLAVLTPGLRSFVLIILLLVLSLYAISEFFLRSSAENDGKPYSTLLFIGVPLALAVWQYAQRRRWLVRAIAAAVYIYFLIPMSPGVSPIGAAHPEIAIRYAPESRRAQPSPSERGKVTIAVPIAITGRDRVQVDPGLISARIRSASTHWDVKWNWYNNVASTGSDWLCLSIPPADYQHLKQAPATVEAEIVLTLYEPVSKTTLRTDAPWTSLGPAGQVRLTWRRTSLNAERRMPLYDSGYRLVFPSPNTNTPETSGGAYPRNWSEFHISPVFFYGAWLDQTYWNSREVLVERPIGRITRTVTIPDVRLEEWALTQ